MGQQKSFISKRKQTLNHFHAIDERQLSLSRKIYQKKAMSLPRHG